MGVSVMNRLAVPAVIAAVLALAAGASGHSVKVSSSAPVRAATVAPSSPPSNPPSGLSAGCQLGIDLGGFQPVSQQNHSQDSTAYLINLQNNTGSPITLTGFSVIFTNSSGNEISTATPQPTAISYATSQGNQIVAKANSLAATAQNYANSHGC
jgi:hypothetical protein